MARIHYRIVAHDGGWAYKLNDVFSEPFASKSAALAAAKRVAAEQHIPGDTTHIEFQDENGAWHTELSEGRRSTRCRCRRLTHGNDRPTTFAASCRI